MHVCMTHGYNHEEAIETGGSDKKEQYNTYFIVKYLLFLFIALILITCLI
jgi:hypothetical protein